MNYGLDFDWKFYLLVNPDLRMHGITNAISARRHFEQFGKNENRLCNKNQSEAHQFVEERIRLFRMNHINLFAFDKKISIVMTHFNRISQLEQTLQSFAQYVNIYNFEVVVVDDGSDDVQKLENMMCLYMFASLHIILKKDKTWVNPVIAYNKGFECATGDIIIIQNAEIAHVGDVICSTINNISPNKYLVFSVFNSPTFFHNNLLSKMRHTGNEVKFCKYCDYSLLAQSGIYCPPKVIHKWHGWLSHPIYNRRCFHFLSAVYKKVLTKMGGFDNKFAHGLNYDDDDFIMRMSQSVESIEIVDPSVCYGVHQYHLPCSADDSLTNINKALYADAFNLSLK